MNYKKNKQWNLVYENEQLIVTAGADELYLINNLNSQKSEELYRAYKNDSLIEIIDDEEYMSVLKKLEKSGVIYKSKENNTDNIEVEVKWLGHEVQKIQELLKSYSNSSEGIHLSTKKIKNADLVIIIRQSGSLVEILDSYEKIQLPHLFVDIAYDHTVSLGPFVFPGETACLSCFIGRVTRNWGDIEPPQNPSVARRKELVAGIIFNEIRTFAEQGSCPSLIEKVWSMNIIQMTAKIDSLFRLPWCPVCYPEKQKEGMGSFELPWTIKDSQK